MSDALLDQGPALARETPAVLCLNVRGNHHGANTWLTALERHECAQQRLAVYRVGLGAAVPSWHGDRRGLDDVAFDLVRLQHTMDPEAIEAGLLDGYNIDGQVGMPL